jgi:Na+-translocating ferredoxin:NAD+ oxidoreductase RnfG subunit
LAPIPWVARAATYLTEAQAAAVLFPGVSLQPGWVEMSRAEVKRVEKTSGQRVPTARLRLLRGPAGQALLIDRVLGKHEWITYAVGINPDGTIRGVEVMDYRESFGGEIRDARWRAKFSGKTARDPVTLGQDIPNISGATLSSRHVTDGVRRLLQTYDFLKSQGRL